MAIGAGYGNGAEGESYQSTRNSQKVTARMEIDACDLYTSFGYRANRSVLYYGSVIYTKYKVDSKNSSSSIIETKLKKSAEIMVLNLGIQLMTKSSENGVTFESGVMKTFWDGRHKWTYPLVLSLSYYW